jgi:integrase
VAAERSTPDGDLYRKDLTKELRTTDRPSVLTQCDAVLAHLPDDLQPVFAVAYLTGWRVKSELLTRQRAHVDFQSGWLRLEPGETKNAEGRQFPLTPALRAVLERQRARTLAVEKATRTIIPWLFHRAGRPIKSFRRAWLTACTAAGLSDRIPHDFRRTAVRNLERAGVPRSRGTHPWNPPRA